jgi:hypothetical protein
MTKAHKEDEKVFRMAEMRFASAFRVVADDTGSVLGTSVATMEGADPDSWCAYVTDDEGASFHPAGWQFREYPFPPTLIQLVDQASVETDPGRVAGLRLALKKWRELLNSN